MTTEGFKQKLKAILSADVKDYSRLMSQDRVATINTLKSHRDLFADFIQQYGGRIIDTPGDNILAVIDSVSDAVNCATEIQRELSERNAEVPSARMMKWRIGVNLGDVVEEDDRIYGDGVNIAARVENLCEPGGICVSGIVHDQVKGKLGLEYESLGEQEIKNLPDPIRVYRVLSYPGAAAHRVTKAKADLNKKWRNTPFIVIAIIAIGAGSILIWNFISQKSITPAEVAVTGEAFAPVEKTAILEKPSIAVLPFDNMSQDPSDDYLGDAIADAIITGLSKVPSLAVIARNSSFIYRNTPVKIQQIGKDLDVHYVLEGSIQKSGNRLRITAQLIDAATENHMWSENFDQYWEDLFSIQDSISTKVMTAIQVELTHGEQVRAWERGTENADAYIKFLQAFSYMEAFKSEELALARELSEEAIALDPGFAAVYGLQSFIRLMDVFLGTNISPDESLEQAEKLVNKALSINENEFISRCVLGYICSLKRLYEQGITECEKAIAINPNWSFGHFWLGVTLYNAGRYEESMAQINRAIRLNPYPPGYYLNNLALVKWITGQYEEAIILGKKVEKDSRRLESEAPPIILALAYVSLGLEEKAREEAKKLLEINPEFSIEKRLWGMPFKDKDVAERYRTNLRKAGLK